MIYILIQISSIILDCYLIFEIIKYRKEISKLKNEINSLKPKGVKQIITG